jgi:hypothetical protein
MKRVVLLAALVLAVAFADACCRTWLVNPDGSGDAPSIKAALYDGAHGDTVLLADGTFTGHDNTEVSFMGKAIVVRSQSGNPHACIIDCMGSELNWSRGFLFYYGEGAGSVLEGVTIVNGYGYEGGGIWCWGSSPTIRNVIIMDNTALFSGGGLYCGSSSSPGLEGVTVYGNTSPDGGGFCCVSGASPVIRNTIIAYNRDGGAIRLTDPDCAPSFACCDIYGNVGGDWSPWVGDQYGIDGNISLDPLFCLEDNPKEPLTLRSSSPCAPGYHLLCGHMGAAGVGCWLGITADIDIEPQTLNPKSGGRWITCYIELDGGLAPEEIDVGTVRLNDSIPAALRPSGIGDHDGDGVSDLMVKFPRGDVIGMLEGCGDIGFVVSGEAAGLEFAGTDTVQVLCLDGHVKEIRGRAVAAGGPILSILAGDMFGGWATIRLEIAEPGTVTLSVYGVDGRLVRRLLDGYMRPDTYSVEWDGLDSAGSRVASGVYFLRLETGQGAASGRAVIVR